MADQTNNVQAPANTNEEKPVMKQLTVALLESFYSGISQDERETQAALVEKTKARIPTLYAAFKETSEADFSLVVRQWKESHKGERSAGVRVSEATALFFAQRRVEAEFPDIGYHAAVKKAREALDKAGYRSNGLKKLSEADQDFNKLKNAKAKANRQLEEELGTRFYTMDDEELAKLKKARVQQILSPSTVAMEDVAKAEVIEHGKMHALHHIEALALALGVEIEHKDGMLSIVIDEAAMLEEEETHESEEKKAA